MGPATWHLDRHDLPGLNPHAAFGMSRSQNVGRNLLWGLKYGLTLGVGYSALALILEGATGGEATRRTGVAMEVAILVYLLGCSAFGLLLGLMRPLLRSRLGAIAAGMIAGLPFSFLIFATMDLPESTTSQRVVQAIVFGFIMGGVTGNMVYGWLRQRA